MNTTPIVSPQEWEAARQQLLVKEKALTRARDALAAERRRMPWVAVDGHNAFFRDGERVFRTYFSNNRGDEAMGITRASGNVGRFAGRLSPETTL
jgi:predicted dithiol-disulfide oxidoreductase (DUF899 family)